MNVGKRGGTVNDHALGGDGVGVEQGAVGRGEAGGEGVGERSGTRRKARVLIAHRKADREMFWLAEGMKQEKHQNESYK